ncbi:MAG: hypothetical protein A3F83_14595 [Candidatus Glassbacteria bacterium RIFCSPLOWO2_12_FULL_58_11]|uniref:Uncharacterized protein n=1 Tax=Candidatus Glassbacteria bacterium RIFCSPLOWO2_12_FULL_58_11 TaxID=1817867 RepID=A0A1F5YLW5_9BACT|nr:MAG: hypothetical protein A3F83_14595 [Candidatus Glassbacteria bacterium RIFCSPLOWO2_12_FULL_58_11]
MNFSLKKPRGARRWPLAAALIISLCVYLGGCGDERIVSLNSSGSLQGVWEGTIALLSSDGDIKQTSRMRLELVQRDFNFEGLLLKIDPLSEGFGRAPVDTFLVVEGSISASFIAFKTLDTSGGSAMFQGQKTDKVISGTALGTDYSGEWSVRFVF